MALEAHQQLLPRKRTQGFHEFGRAAEINGEIERGDGEGDNVGGFVRFDGAHMKLLHVGRILARLDRFVLIKYSAAPSG